MLVVMIDPELEFRDVEGIGRGEGRKGEGAGGEVGRRERGGGEDARRQLQRRTVTQAVR